MEILIFFFIFCLVIGAIKMLWDAFKKFIPYLLALVVIIAAVVFLWSVVLPALPLILCVLTVLFVLGCIGLSIGKRQYRSQLEWLEERGIEKISVSQIDWSKPIKLGFVETIAAEYVISTPFYKKILNKISQTGALTRDTFEEYCVQNAKEFQLIYVDPFIEFLQKKDQLFPFFSSADETHYLSKPFVAKCENLFMAEGAATTDEFAQICGNSAVTNKLRQESRALAAAILNYMLSHGKVEEIELSELGDRLYVAKDQKKDSKMTRREIKL